MISRHLRTTFLAITALCLAVLFSSCSKKDVVQAEDASAAIEGAPIAEETPAPEPGAALPEAPTGTAADAGVTAPNMSAVYFEFDSYRLTSAGRNSLKENADWMKANPSSNIQVEGHCDDRGTTEYNLALGERRANAAVEYLVKVGVDKSRLSTISYGEERPAVPGTGDEAWAKNRRAEFVVLK